jgi:hypothetical protein
MGLFFATSTTPFLLILVIALVSLASLQCGLIISEQMLSLDGFQVENDEVPSSTTVKQFTIGSLDWIFVILFPKIRIGFVLSTLFYFVFIRKPGVFIIFSVFITVPKLCFEGVRLSYLANAWVNCKNTWFCHSLAISDGISDIPSFMFEYTFWCSLVFFLIPVVEVIIVSLCMKEVKIALGKETVIVKGKLTMISADMNECDDSRVPVSSYSNDNLYGFGFSGYEQAGGLFHSTKKIQHRF